MKAAVFIYGLSFILNSTSFAQPMLQDEPVSEIAYQLQSQVLNYPNHDSILQNKKLEIGVVMPGREQTMIINFLQKARIQNAYKLNPFLDWEVDVEATFKHTNTGKTEKVDAFYYRDYVRDTVWNDWIEQATQFPFRVRFCPAIPGEWSYTISIKIRGNEVYLYNDVYFLVVPTTAHGYVKVHENKKNLILDDRIIIPVGQNLLSPVNGVDSYTVRPGETNKAARVDDWLSYHKDISDYEALGGRYIRTVQTAWSSLIEFEEKGNYYNRLHYAWETDQLMDFCEEHNMLMNFNFMFQEPLMAFGQYYTTIWDFDHYKINGESTQHTIDENDPYLAYCYNDGDGEEPHNMFVDENDLRYHEQRMRYYISRYGYSTSIMIFELLSEPGHLDQFYPLDGLEHQDTEKGKIMRDALVNYNTRISEYIKNTMEHKQHLIGVHAFDNSVYWQDTVAQKIIDESCAILTIDVIGFSTYKNDGDRLLITKHNGGISVEEDENSYYKKNVDFWEKYHKPIMHFEQGTSSDAISSNESSGFTPHSIDVRTIGYTGCAGFFAWEGYMHADSTRDQRIAWPQTVVGEKWMNGDSVIRVLEEGNGDWIQGRQAEKHRYFAERKTKETEYYVAADKLHATGFVLNRTFNSYTNASSEEFQKKMTNPGPAFDELETIRWKDGKWLVVASLVPNANYAITWYDGKTGNLISSGKGKSGKTGDFKLRFPTLSVEAGEELRPLVWYTISIINT